jgi:hypothetical protein
MGDTVSIKLNSGEEMIARIEAEDSNHVTVTKPLMLMATENGMGLAPFMFTVSPEAKIKLKLNSIICIVKSAKDAADMYIKQTTGIVTT